MKMELKEGDKVIKGYRENGNMMEVGMSESGVMEEMKGRRGGI